MKPLTPEQVAKLTPEQRAKAIAETRKIIEQARELIPIAFFRPNPPQYRMVKALATTAKWPGNTESERVNSEFAALFGNGVGKSWLIQALIGNIVWGPQNKYFDWPLFKAWPYKKHLRLLVDPPELKENTGEMWKAIMQWWPRHKYKAQKGGYDYLSSFEFYDDSGKPNGFIMDVRTYDQDLRLHESAGLGAAFFNEPPPQGIFQAYGARFREGGFRFIGGTMVFESPWITEEIVENPKGSAYWMMGDIQENCRDYSEIITLPDGTNEKLAGHLSQAAIDQMIDSYPEEEREARKSGKPIHLRGSVFDVDSAIHFVPRETIPKELTTFFVTDPHPNRPWAMIVGGLTETGDYYLVDEWPKLADFDGLPYHKIITDRRGIAEYADIANALIERWRVGENIIDGKFANSPVRTQSMTTTLRDQLLELGLFFFDGNPNVEGDGGGIRKLQQLLRFDKTKPIDFKNRPHFYIADDLTNCRTQVKNLCRVKDKSADGLMYKDKLDDKFLDFPRCMMYLVMHRATFSTPPSVSSPDQECSRLAQAALDKRLAAEDAMTNA